MSGPVGLSGPPGSRGPRVISDSMSLVAQHDVQFSSRGKASICSVLVLCLGNDWCPWSQRRLRGDGATCEYPQALQSCYLYLVCFDMSVMNKHPVTFTNICTAMCPHWSQILWHDCDIYVWTVHGAFKIKTLTSQSAFSSRGAVILHRHSRQRRSLHLNLELLMALSNRDWA